MICQDHAQSAKNSCSDECRASDGDEMHAGKRELKAAKGMLTVQAARICLYKDSTSWKSFSSGSSSGLKEWL